MPMDGMVVISKDDGDAHKQLEEVREQAQESNEEVIPKIEQQEPKTEAKAPKRWTVSFSSLFSLPILKILQGIWLIIMIKGSLSGGVMSLFSFGSSPDSANKPTKISPFYAEMRSDLYGDELQFRKPENEEKLGLLSILFGPKPVELTLPQNTGIPQTQRIVMSNLNREYESFRYSVKAATTSKVQASYEFAQISFQRALEKTLSRITCMQDVHSLTILEENYLKEANSLIDTKDSLKKALIGPDSDTFENDEQCIETKPPVLVSNYLSMPNNETQCLLEWETVANQTKENKATCEDDHVHDSIMGRNVTLQRIKGIDQDLSNVTSCFLKRIKESLPDGIANAINDVILGHISQRGIPSLVEILNTLPMRILLSDVKKQKQRVFVLSFLGDLYASQVETLRKEVTAILRSATPSDEVMVILQSSGGTVTGYGLVAAQLLRIKESGLRLTVAVEQVAASGGYLVASVASTIICSPFAVVGSIGVIQEVPNIHKRLNSEGVEFHSITAGKYKRVLSSTKEVTSDDLAKAKADLEEIHTLFQEFVKENRPSIDLDVVATGEIWFGTRAVEVGLCDAIKTADSLLMDYVDSGFDVFHLKYEDPLQGFLNKFLGDWKESTSISTMQGITKVVLQWISQNLLPLLNGELDNNNNNPMFM
jgi:serine protease SohB